MQETLGGVEGGMGARKCMCVCVREIEKDAEREREREREKQREREREKQRERERERVTSALPSCEYSSIHPRTCGRDRGRG